MRKLFIGLVILDAAMFAYAPFAINAAPYQSTMLLVQKIFYFHFATWMAVTAGLVVFGVAGGGYLFKRSPPEGQIDPAPSEDWVAVSLFARGPGAPWALRW